MTQYACRAIGTLAEYPGNKEILERHHVCAAVTAAVQRHVGSGSILAVFSKDTGSAAVALWGCHAIYYIARGKLSTTSSSCKNIVTRSKLSAIEIDCLILSKLLSLDCTI